MYFTIISFWKLHIESIKLHTKSQWMVFWLSVVWLGAINDNERYNNVFFFRGVYYVYIYLIWFANFCVWVYYKLSGCPRIPFNLIFSLYIAFMSLFFSYIQDFRIQWNSFQMRSFWGYFDSWVQKILLHVV